MTTIVRAELLRLVRRRTVWIVGVAAVVFSVVAALAVFSSASTNTERSIQGGTTVAALVGHGGGTEAFAVGAGFLGFFVFVLFIAIIATEFSGGTFRSMLLRDPHRRRMIVGKLVGILLVTAAALALAEFCTFVMSLIVAPSKDIATSGWFTLDGLGAALQHYGTVLGGVTGWALFGTALAVVFRSAPVALGVGFAWAGPLEHIIGRSWSGSYEWFPGLALDSFIQGGTAELALGRAMLTALAYGVVAATVTLVLVSRRDVTA
jgi:ABC-2 type transport system permease protein